MDKDDKPEDLAHENTICDIQKNTRGPSVFQLCLAQFVLDCVGGISLHCSAALLIWVGAQVCSASTTLCRCAIANRVHGCPLYSAVINMDLNPVELLKCK